MILLKKSYLKFFLGTLALIASVVGCSSSNTLSVHNIQLDLNTVATQESPLVWPVSKPIAPPDSLRPCCAFGYDMQVSLFGIPVPFYMLSNLVDLNALGVHSYNDSSLTGVANITGLSREKLGVMYSNQGGFLDIAHVRDTADNVLYLFTQIYPRLGQTFSISLSAELFERRIQFFSTDISKLTSEQRYTLAAYMASFAAYQMAVWHEVAQWYGFQSVPGFSEEISAFSPEDLYSNLLGARIATSVILEGNAASIKQYNRAMKFALPKALLALEGVSVEASKAKFNEIDGVWWDSQRRIPEKYLVLYRDYSLAYDRKPATLDGNGLRLTLTDTLYGLNFDQLMEFQLWVTAKKGQKPYYFTLNDAQIMANQAKVADEKRLHQMHIK